MKSLIDRIILLEGGDKETNDPSDSGGRTKFGISEKANPDAWADGEVTLEEAREVYWKKYVALEQLDQIPNSFLFKQVVDFGVTAGPDRAVRLLQEVLDVPQDGVLGPASLRKLALYPPRSFYGMFLPGHVAVNIDFERARAKFYIKLAQKRPKDLKWLWGWVKRTFSWSSDEPHQ